jgi:hypothetical protein
MIEDTKSNKPIRGAIYLKGVKTQLESPIDYLRSDPVYVPFPVMCVCLVWLHPRFRTIPLSIRFQILQSRIFNLCE